VKEFAVYTAARIGMFLAAYALVVGVYLLVSGGGAVPLLWPFVAAIVISAAASAYLLKGQRARFTVVVDRRARAATARYEENRAKEDEGEG
jgi:hypothetical protein